MKINTFTIVTEENLCHTACVYNEKHIVKEGQVFLCSLWRKELESLYSYDLDDYNVYRCAGCLKIIEDSADD